MFKRLIFALGPDGDMSIPGEAGVDFPVYSAVPDTGFDCGAQEFPGIYGDVDGNCQVFHMCAPNGNADSCESSDKKTLVGDEADQFLFL